MKPLKRKNTSITIIALLFSVIPSFGQNTISLDKAIEVALENNKMIKIAQLQEQYSKALIKSNATIPNTVVFSEFGNVNSNFTDTKFGIAQNIAFPTVYSKQKQVLVEENILSQQLVKLSEYELKKKVTQLFYQITLLKQKEELLKKSDSLFAQFVNKTTLRFQKGESAVLEKVIAENQKNAIQIQLKQLQTEFNILVLEFQFVLNSEIVYLPDFSEFKIKASIENATSDTNPSVQLLQQNIKIVAAEKKLQRAKLLPEIIFGYNNNSFVGIGLNDLNRYSSFQVGLGIPLFGGSQQAKLKALNISESIANDTYDLKKKTLAVELQMLQFNLQNTIETVQYFENKALKNAQLIEKTAGVQFQNGDINYLDFVMLINQSIEIKKNYLEALHELNNTHIKINFLN